MIGRNTIRGALWGSLLVAALAVEGHAAELRFEHALSFGSKRRLNWME